jgi:Flp pilus assembly protein TadD
VNQQPDFAPAHNLLGIAYAQSGNTASAIEQFRRALALDPGLVDARSNLDQALARKP